MTKINYKLVIGAKLPGLNDLIAAERNHRMSGAKLKKDAEDTVRLFIRQQIRGIRPAPPVTLHYHFYEPHKRRDKDNISAFAHKVIQDTLVKEGILKNDGWADIDGFTDEFSVDPDSPRIEVIIEEGE